MQRSAVLTSLLLSIGLLASTAQAADAVTADRATGMSQVGTVTVQGIIGSPQDVENAVAKKAQSRGASYYRIITMQDSANQRSWHATAAIYR